MPSQGFIDKVFDTVLSQGGLSMTFLLLAVGYILRQWAMERREHNATRDKLFIMAEKQNVTNGTVSEALVGLKVVLETTLRRNG